MKVINKTPCKNFPIARCAPALANAHAIRMSNYLKDMPQNRQYTIILVSSQVLTQQYQASAKTGAHHRNTGARIYKTRAHNYTEMPHVT